MFLDALMSLSVTTLQCELVELEVIESSIIRLVFTSFDSGMRLLNHKERILKKMEPEKKKRNIFALF